MIYLDTHVVVWLYAGLVNQFSETIKNYLNEEELLISPIVRLELQYLYEMGRVNIPANEIVLDLSDRIGLKDCAKDFNTVISQAITVD